VNLFVYRDEFARMLEHVLGVVERRTTTPVASQVLLHARPAKGICVSATDSEVAFVGDVTACVSAGGAVGVDAALLYQTIRALPASLVQLSLDGTRLDVRSGESGFRLSGMASEDLPPLPRFERKGGIRLASTALRRIIDQTHYAVSADDVRYGLNGAHLQEVTAPDGARRLRMVTTDGHRLSASEADFAGTCVVPRRMLVPRKALGVLRRSLESIANDVELAFGENAIRVSWPDALFWFRLLDGEFPDYESVLPGAPKHRIVANTADLAAALRRVLIVVADRTRAVRFAFDEERCAIDVHNLDRGEVNEEVSTSVEGGAVTVGFNPRYLADVLGVLSGERVQLELAHLLAPCLVRDPDDGRAFFVVMPMRLDDVPATRLPPPGAGLLRPAPGPANHRLSRNASSASISASVSADVSPISPLRENSSTSRSVAADPSWKYGAVANAPVSDGVFIGVPPRIEAEPLSV
jgi:DNA polymerase-3 subunit beta